MKVPVRSILPAPGTPSFLAFSEITSTTLNVSWGEPLAANGILQGYRVVYEPLAPVQGKARGEQGEGQLTGAQSPTVHRVSRVSPWRARRLAGWGPGEQRPSRDQSLCFLGSSTALSTGLCVMSLDLVSLIPKPFSPVPPETPVLLGARRDHRVRHLLEPQRATLASKTPSTSRERCWQPTVLRYFSGATLHSFIHSISIY